MALISYSDFQKKLSVVGLTISQITGRVVDDQRILLEASIVGLDQNSKLAIVKESLSKAPYVGDGEDLFDLIYKLWHLATDQELFIRSNGLLTEVVEWDWGKGTNTGKFFKRTITKEEVEKVTEIGLT